MNINRNCIEKLQQLPVLFISHGGPTTSFRDYTLGDKKSTDAYCDAMEALGMQLLPNFIIKNIIVISAHYETSSFSIVNDDSPQTIHDHGFKSIMNYRCKSPGSSQFANEIYSELKNHNLPTKLDQSWGFDHGVWSVVKLLNQEENIPVVNISVNNSYSPQEHINLGKALNKFRNEGSLIVCSGSSTHNLQDMFSSIRSNSKPKYLQNYGEFEDLLQQISTNQNQEEREKLALAITKDKNYKLCHPSHDHFFPYLVGIGAAGSSHGKRFIEESQGCYIYGETLKQ